MDFGVAICTVTHTKILISVAKYENKHEELTHLKMGSTKNKETPPAKAPHLDNSQSIPTITKTN